jgi:long-chain fatty acid transport protein
MRFKFILFRIGSIAFIFLNLSTQIATAGGFAIAEQTARGVGRGNAITAGVEDPSAAYVNPAALVEVPGNQLMSGLNYVNTQSRVENSGRTSKNFHDDDFLPNLFADYHIPHTNLTVGLGSYTPFGLATSYDPSSFTRFAAIDSELKTIYVTPSIAWQPSEIFSIGGGLSFVHSSAVLSRSLFLGAVGIGEGRLRITGTDNAFGYNIGLLVKPHDQVKIGFTYRSRVGLEFDHSNVKFTDAAIAGGLPTNTKASGINVPIPAVINSGIQWQIFPNWQVEFDYNFTHWSEFKNLKARFNSPLPALGGAVLIPGFSLPQDWKDTSTFRVGTSYKATENLELRTGFSLDQTPIPDRTLSPAIPGANILTLNGGIGYTWKRINLDLGYMAIFYQERRVNNNVLETGNNPSALPFPGVPGPDKYTIFQNFVALNVSYRF